MDDFYSVSRQLDQIIDLASSPDHPDPVEAREELKRVLQRLAPAARKLVDDLRDHPPGEPIILYDGCDGEWEERAYVPVSMATTAKEAIRAIPAASREWVTDEPGFYLYCDPDRRAHLAPATYNHGDEDWRYASCQRGAVGGSAFWVVEVAERRFSVRRGLDRLVRSWRSYRHGRRRGQGRWEATVVFRINFSPLRRGAIGRLLRQRRLRRRRQVA